MGTANKSLITKRSEKSTALTHPELDQNFSELENVIDDSVNLENGKVSKGEVGSEQVESATGTQSIPDALDQRVVYVDTLADLQALPTGGLVDGQEASVNGTPYKWSVSSDSWNLIWVNISGAAGGYNILHNPNTNVIAGGDANTIAGGGLNVSNNRILLSTDYRTISGGYDNEINGSIASTISGGAHQVITSSTTHGTIGGGSFNEIQLGDYCIIGGGTGNTVTDTQSTISGGINNTAGDTASVGGGSTNSATSRYSTVSGGVLNKAGSTSAVVSGGDGNEVTNALQATIGGGFQNLLGSATFDANKATLSGGHQNTIAQTARAQYATMSGGRENTIDSDYATVVGGRLNKANGDFSVASGLLARTDYRGEQAHSSFTGGQSSRVNLGVVTTDGTATELTLDNTSELFFIRNNVVWGITATVVATRTDVVGEYAMYKVTAAIKQDSGGVLTLSQNVEVIHETTAAWDLLFATASNGLIRFRAIGEAGKTIQWFASVDISEVETA